MDLDLGYSTCLIPACSFLLATAGGWLIRDLFAGACWGGAIWHAHARLWV